MIANYIRFNYGLRWTNETQAMINSAVHASELIIGLLIILKVCMWAMLN